MYAIGDGSIVRSRVRRLVMAQPVRFDECDRMKITDASATDNPAGEGRNLSTQGKLPVGLLKRVKVIEYVLHVHSMRDWTE